MENTDKPSFSPSEQLVIDEAVRTGGPIMKQPWMQDYIVRRMKKEVERIRATMPKPPKPDVDGARYHAERRVKWRGNFATHEAGTDGLPICPQRSPGWEDPKHADEMEHLGPGPVNCGHCENAR